MKKIIKIFCVISLFLANMVYADIKFWTTEVQPARMAKQEEMAKAFEAKTGRLMLFQLKKKNWVLELLLLLQPEICQM